jgi:methionyl-tRNA formyltransferase
MKLVFLGTPTFAVPTLEACANDGHQIAAVFTQPDRPKGRGQQTSMPPVKEAALRLGLEVHQPERIRRVEVVEQLRTIAPDAMVIVGYGQIVPQAILDIPPHGIINVHASLLPQYRGAAPIQWAIARGETTTGVTTMKIDAGLDTGDILLQWKTSIGPEETALELGPRLATAGADLLLQTLHNIITIRPKPQNDEEATLAPILTKADGHIDWTLSAQEIHNRIRGFLPWPGGYGFLRGARFHIWKAHAVEDTAANVGERLQPGALHANKSGIFASCGAGSLELLEIQLEGKKRMDARAFLNGFALQEKETLA